MVTAPAAIAVALVGLFYVVIPMFSSEPLPGRVVGNDRIDGDPPLFRPIVGFQLKDGKPGRVRGLSRFNREKPWPIGAAAEVNPRPMARVTSIDTDDIVEVEQH